MSLKLYLSDTYLQATTAVVTAVNEDGGHLLDQTVFYPGGGGQPADEGVLVVDGQHYPVVKMVHQEGRPWHYLEGVTLPVGTVVTARIDWQRRYQLMRTHTAMHILCGVIWRDYQASVTGGNMDPLQGRMDFEFESMRQELVSEIETAVNREVAAASMVMVEVLPRAVAFAIPDLIRTKINLLPPGIPEIRTVEIVGLDLQADGGTHVANTIEVGRMRITDYRSKGKINKRLYVQLDEA